MNTNQAIRNQASHTNTDNFAFSRRRSFLVNVGGAKSHIVTQSSVKICDFEMCDLRDCESVISRSRGPADQQ